uniref:Uncharacterized protein n=1 Tax=Romanomermis culicivorax TaxID=13658 RepID=A0A915KGM3_ROMCU
MEPPETLWGNKSSTGFRKTSKRRQELETAKTAAVAKQSRLFLAERFKLLALRSVTSKRAMCYSPFCLSKGGSYLESWKTLKNISSVVSRAPGGIFNTTCVDSETNVPPSGPIICLTLANSTHSWRLKFGLAAKGGLIFDADNPRSTKFDWAIFGAKLDTTSEAEYTGRRLMVVTFDSVDDDVLPESLGGVSVSTKT